MNDNQRTQNFNLIKKQLEDQGYLGKECTISIFKANIMAAVTAAPIVVVCVWLFKCINDQIHFTFTFWNGVLFWVCLIASIFIHELLHGVTWGFYCKNKWKDIHLGVVWKKLTPFCCSMQPLTFKQYILGGLMPLIVLGMGVFLISILINSYFLLVLSMFNIIAAGGDITISFMLLKHKRALIFDHPTECGFWAFYHYE